MSAQKLRRNMVTLSTSLSILTLRETSTLNLIVSREARMPSRALMADISEEE